MVKRTLKNGRSLLFKTQDTIISAAFVISVTYGMAALLGLFRARLLASYFGASESLGVFYTADKIPSFIYTILVVGTISTIFIPVFTGILKKDNKAAWHTASSMLTVSVLMFVAIGALIYIFATPIIKAISLGQFSIEQVSLGAKLMRIMLAAQILLVVSSFFTSILQSFKHFLLPALAPVFYNIGTILGIIFLSDMYGIYGPAYGVLIGSFLHLLIQVPLLRKTGFKYSFSLGFRDKGIGQIFSLMPPRIIGSAITQLSGIINNSLVILVSTSSVVVFKFASQLQTFPVLLFGSAIAQAALPTLSYESSVADRKLFKRTFLTSFHQTMFLVIPASVVLLILKLPVVRLVYGAANFPWEATLQTSYALAFFSLSIFAQSGIYLLNRAFYALKDTLTPVKIGVFTIFLSVSLSTFFVKYLGLGVWSVAFSFSIASIIDLVALMWLLHKKVGGFNLERLFNPFIKISYAALFMGISLYVPMKWLDIAVLDTTKTVQLILLTVIAGVAGIFSYIFFTRLFKVEEVALLYKLVSKFRPKFLSKSRIASEQLPAE